MTYVIPLVAIVLGFILLEERLQPVELVGAVLIISGVVLVNARIGRGSRDARTHSMADER